MRFCGANASATLGSSVPCLLSRRTNIRSLAEIEAERVARQPKPTPIEVISPPRYVYLTPAQKIERNLRIKELWLIGNSMREIHELTGIQQGTGASVINKLGLAGMGGKCKKFIKRRYKNTPIDEHP
jgi:hypothetical protein